MPGIAPEFRKWWIPGIVGNSRSGIPEALAEENSEAAFTSDPAPRGTDRRNMPQYAAICRNMPHEDRRANETWTSMHLVKFACDDVTW